MVRRRPATHAVRRTWPASNVASSFPPQGTQPVFATLRTCRAGTSHLADAGQRKGQRGDLGCPISTIWRTHRSYISLLLGHAHQHVWFTVPSVCMLSLVQHMVLMKCSLARRLLVHGYMSSFAYGMQPAWCRIASNGQHDGHVDCVEHSSPPHRVRWQSNRPAAVCRTSPGTAPAQRAPHCSTCTPRPRTAAAEACHSAKQTALCASQQMTGHVPQAWKAEAVDIF